MPKRTRPSGSFPVPDSGIVYKIEPGMDPAKVLATTYQMRNFYRQLGDGFFSDLDVMNYIQHHEIALWARANDQVLDVCCGRGLLLPLLRYLRPKIGGYTGVDIEPKNAVWQRQRVTDGKPIEPGYYPFPVRFVEANVATMSGSIQERFDLIVYTSAIEHMQHDAGLASLAECRTLARPGATLVLTCPNTPEDHSGFDTQYAAHVYEWKRSELDAALAATGWRVTERWGLLVKRADIEPELKRLHLTALVDRLARYVPTDWLMPMLAPMFPNQAREIGMRATAI